MSFTDPAVDSKHVPLHVMEDLIWSDQRLLQKLFNALIVNKFPHKAAGLYLRNNFRKWAPKHIKDKFDSLPQYDQSEDPAYIEDFAPVK